MIWEHNLSHIKLNNVIAPLPSHGLKQFKCLASSAAAPTIELS